MTKWLFIVTSGLLLIGCSTPGKNMSLADQTELDIPLYCEGEQQCKDLWERATYYVSTNSRYKIQNVNDTLIETYSPTQSDTHLAWKIIKKPLGGGKYHIQTVAWCNNVFGCYPDSYEAMLNAKRYMKEGL